MPTLVHGFQQLYINKLNIMNIITSDGHTLINMQFHDCDIMSSIVITITSLSLTFDHDWPEINRRKPR